MPNTMPNFKNLSPIARLFQILVYSSPAIINYDFDGPFYPVALFCLGLPKSNNIAEFVSRPLHMCVDV